MNFEPPEALRDALSVIEVVSVDTDLCSTRVTIRLSRLDEDVAGVLHSAVSQLRALMQFDSCEITRTDLPRKYKHVLEPLMSPSVKTMPMPRDCDITIAFGFNDASPLAGMRAFYDYLAVLLRCDSSAGNWQAGDKLEITINPGIVEYC